MFLQHFGAPKSDFVGERAGVEIVIVGYSTYVNKAWASVHMSFEAQALVRMSFEVRTSVCMYKLGCEQNDVMTHCYTYC